MAAVVRRTSADAVFGCEIYRGRRHDVARSAARARNLVPGAGSVRQSVAASAPAMIRMSSAGTTSSATPPATGKHAFTASPPPSRWRASPRRLASLALGLVLFGSGEALVVAAGLGNSPWTVLAEGLALHTPLGVGGATIAISALVLLAWIPLRQRPGLGTIANAIVVGWVLGAVLVAIGGFGGALTRAAGLLGGIALVGLGSGLYLGAALGPGPRDGLMTGLHRRTGQPVAGVRAAIELTAVAVGAVLGGTIGLGTLVFAVLIGPAVAMGLRILSAVPTAEL